MTDIPVDSAPAPVADTPATPVADAPVEDAPVSTPAEETFPRTYVEELRQESAKYRTKVKPYEDAFADYDDDSRQAFLSLARDLIEAPEDAARRMLQVSRELLGDEFDKVLSDPTPKPLTKDDVERLLAEKETVAQQQAAIRAVEDEATALGYAEKSADRAFLFSIASTETAGDLKAAHEKIESRKQEIIDAYLAEKQGQADAFPTPTTAGVGAGQDNGPAKDFTEARRRFEARSAASLGQ